jgi:spore coat polysaccharide biosynthesis protein SpsF (cytidylyltransferase family)
VVKIKNSAVFITVRTASTRLPNKCLLKINNKTVIEHIIYRAKQIKNVDKIILCTTTDKADDILEKIGLQNKILVFRGSIKDKLQRWKDACEFYEIESFVTFDADDLFCEPKLNEIALCQLNNNGVHFIHSDNVVPGAFTYAIKYEALKKVCSIKDTDDTEMMWPFFMDTGLFNIKNLQADNLNEYSSNGLRITLDYIEDFHFFKEIFKKMKIINNSISLTEIIKFLDYNPDLKNLNYFREKEWANNQKNKINLSFTHND